MGNSGYKEKILLDDAREWVCADAHENCIYVQKHKGAIIKYVPFDTKVVVSLDLINGFDVAFVIKSLHKFSLGSCILTTLLLKNGFTTTLTST